MNGLQRAARDGLRRVRAAAEQYAVQTGQHPRVTTEANIANMRRQLRALGLGHDPRRGVGHHRCRLLPVDAVDLPADLRLLVRRRRRPGPPDRRARRTSSRGGALRDARRHRRSTSSTRCEQRELVDSYRLAYLAEAPVNWCPGLGHRARQRRGHRRRPQRARQLPGLPAAAEAVDAAHHRVRRPAARRSRPRSTGPSRSS